MIERDNYDGVIKIRMARNVPVLPAYYTSCYWVDGLMVDTGCAHCAREFAQVTADLTISQVVNSHSHEDHIGNNAACQGRGASVQAHPLALPFLENPASLRLHPYRHVFWGTPLPCQPSPVGETVETEHHRFQVVGTPGHSPDHLCLHEPQRGWIFTGDAYVGGRDKALREEFDIYQIIASLKALAALPAARLYPASGSVVDDPADALARKIAYLEETGERVRALHAQGKPVSQIRQELFGPEMLIAYVTLGNFSAANLVKSYLRHLENARSGDE